MSTILSRQQIYDVFITELKSQQVLITDDNEGSIVDILAGITSQIFAEIQNIMIQEFAKTFFESADGPEVTGGPDDLETLAVDHFGDDFARPDATKASGTVTFSRANDDAGDCTIPAGTAVLTAANASGVKTRFLTVAEVVLTGTEIDASVECDTAGAAGNIAAEKIISIESTLTDPSVVVTNDEVMSGGEDEENDAQYRETIRNLLKSLKGATLLAIEAKARTVPGVETATAIETLVPVIEYDIGDEDIADGAEFFRFPYAKVYVADTNGTASDSLVEAVQAAIDEVRAAGVKITAIGADPLEQDWAASITLNGSGPNFAELSTNKQKILDSMTQYVSELPIGSGFSRAAANNAILAIWGPAGTDDLTAFSTSVPTGDVSVSATQKLIPGDILIV